MLIQIKVLLQVSSIIKLRVRQSSICSCLQFILKTLDMSRGCCSDKGVVFTNRLKCKAGVLKGWRRNGRENPEKGVGVLQRKSSVSVARCDLKICNVKHAHFY